MATKSVKTAPVPKGITKKAPVIVVSVTPIASSTVTPVVVTNTPTTGVTNPTTSTVTNTPTTGVTSTVTPVSTSVVTREVTSTEPATDVPNPVPIEKHVKDYGDMLLLAVFKDIAEMHESVGEDPLRQNWQTLDQFNAEYEAKTQPLSEEDKKKRDAELKLRKEKIEAKKSMTEEAKKALAEENKKRLVEARKKYTEELKKKKEEDPNFNANTIVKKSVNNGEVRQIIAHFLLKLVDEINTAKIEDKLVDLTGVRINDPVRLADYAYYFPNCALNANEINQLRAVMQEYSDSGNGSVLQFMVNTIKKTSLVDTSVLFNTYDDTKHFHGKLYFNTRIAESIVGYKTNVYVKGLISKVFDLFFKCIVKTAGEQMWFHNTTFDKSLLDAIVVNFSIHPELKAEMFSDLREPAKKKKATDAEDLNAIIDSA